MEKMRLWFEQNKGTPPRGDTSPGFDMGDFWKHCCSGQNKELFAAALSESLNMKAAHEARLEGKLPGAEFSPAQKMQKMRLWFEHNEGIPHEARLGERAPERADLATRGSCARPRSGGRRAISRGDRSA